MLIFFLAHLAQFVFRDGVTDVLLPSISTWPRVGLWLSRIEDAPEWICLEPERPITTKISFRMATDILDPQGLPGLQVCWRGRALSPAI